MLLAIETAASVPLGGVFMKNSAKSSNHAKATHKDHTIQR